MRKWMLACISFVFLSMFTTVWASPSTDNKAAQTTIENWFVAMKNGEVEKAASYLAPQFLSIHTDGLVRNKEQEITLIKNLQMKEYKLTNFKFSRSNNTVVVTYLDQSAEKIDNKEVGDQAAGRMAVLQKQGKKWIIIAYANLDKIG